ncbi:hypothetical protein A2331_03205 [Candidatus Falkowbacteria bacterium RIFOXYB2_FULL_34_18]|uniref:Rhodanese domain-containing protein n=1 Tax=Candidatus Falkowbacteria bacterium RIFOXYD2_FULL_34_120 TaxID=1798007 RepID=A0A1F5TMR9_9BACT|nr:MAG: hypothetical protein A2500_02560 [Candidatus Falkowbacteria bacterium RIFOXYC12_FULL_34_55]OGF28586.1 MAG: hypothetical protein A2331_03205 [Candidatus Falkowbacteria bacterium RIFOXYB2_FULL_34_18]OGF38027.1 MAG: hypothetical protein A2466_06920 [Candidatus Falkowbacteria bacterium RIFOXYC2_FULL_34_220]OGF38276.1 MAG: hypothetical protein A2515_04955 [Candidatus Falkowbacteria bacterium RIFOXYD12_FULL_34_57]OGF40188.1 MAG: hypothetical protein A2531_01150 [Candidatus Falkowbacteria bact
MGIRARLRNYDIIKIGFFQENNMEIRLYFFCIIFLAVIIGGARPVHAVLPPNFIFDIGSQIFYIFSLVFTLLSSSFGIVFLYFRKKFFKKKIGHVAGLFFVLFAVLIIFCLSVAVVFFYNEYKQEVEYDKWLTESECFGKSSDNDFSGRINIKFGKVNNRFAYLSNYFGSSMGEQKNDDVIKFIYNYYAKINEGEYEFAYTLSDKKIKFEEYREYYSQISKIEFNNIVRIDDTRSSLELVLYKGDKFQKYDVLLNLSLKEDGSPKEISDAYAVFTERGSVMTNDFYKRNYVEDLAVDNKDFESIIKSKRDDYVVVDIREEFEYGLGGDDDIKNAPNIARIRMADLMTGRWLELPTDKYVYIFCGYGNLRSEDAVRFLRSKNILAFYLKEGLAGWKDFTEGYFSKNEITAKSVKVMSTEDVLGEKEKDNTFVVSSNLYIKGFDFYVNYEMTTNEIDKILDGIPPSSRIILVCHDVLNCSTNQMIWLKLKEKGHVVVGLYNSPWEWERSLSPEVYHQNIN